MINIGIDGHMLGDQSGGNETYYSNILKNMVIPENCKVYLLVKLGTDISLYKDRFEIVYFKSKSSFFRNFLELSTLCKKLKLDLLHTQYFIPIWKPCKIVCTIHDISFEHFKNIFTKKEYYRQKILIPYAVKYSKMIFTDSLYSRNDITYHYGIPDEKIIVTYSAVNSSFRELTEKELNKSQLRKKFGIGDSKYILSVCNLQPRKNLVRLIKAFINMKKRYNGNEQLVIVGKKAWMFNDILKTAIEGCDDIIFTDYVNEIDLIRLYNDAACFIYPSFFEGFGIPPLEAIACGTPVAVSNTTSLPEVIGDAGIYFDPYDEIEIQKAMIKLLQDEDLCKQLRSRGFAQMIKFSWENTSQIIVRSYLQLVQRK